MGTPSLTPQDPFGVNESVWFGGAQIYDVFYLKKYREGFNMPLRLKQ